MLSPDRHLGKGPPVVPSQAYIDIIWEFTKVKYSGPVNMNDVYHPPPRSAQLLHCSVHGFNGTLVTQLK